MQNREYIHVDCAECGGSCKDICVESGLPVHGGLSTWPESLAEMRARIPLLNAQRFQRQQLHALIDEAERVGAWLYSEDSRPHRPTPAWETFPSPKFHEAKDLINRQIAYWYSPTELRSKLDLTNPKNYHPEDFYRFRWRLRYPSDGLKELKLIIDQINKACAEFQERIK